MRKTKIIMSSIILMIASFNVNAVENSYSKTVFEDKKVTVTRMETVYEKKYIKETIKGLDGKSIEYTLEKLVPVKKEVKYTVIKRVPVIKDFQNIKEPERINKNRKMHDLVISRNKTKCSFGNNIKKA